MRRDYESLYALGVAFTAFAAAEAVGGSGFLAAFAAGLVIAALDVELCDCFLDYGEATAEMFLLLTFVAFGVSIIWTGFEVADAPYAAVRRDRAGRPDRVLLPVLSWAGVEAQSRRIIAWVGPRGLSTLLLALLPVFAGVEGSVHLFQITCLVVLLSVVLHGGGIAIFLAKSRQGERRAARAGGAISPAPLAPHPERPATILRPRRRDQCPSGSPSPSSGACGNRASR